MKASDLKHIFHSKLDTIYGNDEVSSFFFLCIEHYLNVARIQLALEPEFTLTNSETDIFFDVLEQLKQQIPIQYVLGETEFYGFPFKVNSSVLIPRPETEELVALIISNCKKQNPNANPIHILDIGTGSGCIAISLAKNLPSAKVYALDVSKEALKVAAYNAKLNDIDITFIEANILNSDCYSVGDSEYKFDIIVSNPPYVRQLEKVEIKPNVLDNEPHLALFVSDENPLVFYKAISDFADNNLKQKGALYFEINQYLGSETKALLVNTKFKDVELHKDINGNERILKAVKI